VKTKIILLPKRPCNRCKGIQYRMEHLEDSGRGEPGIAFWCIKCSGPGHNYGFVRRFQNARKDKSVPLPQDVQRTPDCKCLRCGKAMDALGTGNPKIKADAKPGDVAACLKCGAVMLLTDNLTVLGMTDQEMDDLMANSETMNDIARMVQAIHMIRAEAS